MSALGDEVIHTALPLSIARVPVLHGTVLHFGTAVDHYLHNGGMQLVLVTHRCRTAFEIGHIGIVVCHYQRAFELSRVAGIDAEVCRQLHGAADTFGDVDKRAVGEHSRVECGKEIVLIGDYRAKVLAYEVGMFTDGLTD